MSIGNYGSRRFRHGGGVQMTPQQLQRQRTQQSQFMDMAPPASSGMLAPNSMWQQGIASGVTPRAPQQLQRMQQMQQMQPQQMQSMGQQEWTNPYLSSLPPLQDLPYGQPQQGMQAPSSEEGGPSSSNTYGLTQAQIGRGQRQTQQMSATPQQQQQMQQQMQQQRQQAQQSITPQMQSEYGTLQAKMDKEREQQRANPAIGQSMRSPEEKALLQTFRTAQPPSQNNFGLGFGQPAPTPEEMQRDNLMEQQMMERARTMKPRPDLPFMDSTPTPVGGPGYAQPTSPPPPSFANAPRPPQQMLASGPQLPMMNLSNTASVFDGPARDFGMSNAASTQAQQAALNAPPTQPSAFGQPPVQTPAQAPPTPTNEASGGASGAPTSWKMSIEPMAGGGLIPGYQNGGPVPSTRTVTRKSRNRGIARRSAIRAMERDGGTFVGQDFERLPDGDWRWTITYTVREGRASGGIVGLRGGGMMPYGLAGGGEVPMVLVNGQYIPAYGFGGWLKRNVLRPVLKVAPVAAMFIPGIGPVAAGAIGGIAGMLDKKMGKMTKNPQTGEWETLNAGSWGDSLTHGLKTGIMSAVGRKGVQGASEGLRAGARRAGKKGLAGFLDRAKAVGKGLERSKVEGLLAGAMPVVAGLDQRGAGFQGGPAQSVQVSGPAQRRAADPNAPSGGLDWNSQSAFLPQGATGGLYASRHFGGGLVPGYQEGGEYDDMMIGDEFDRPRRSRPKPRSRPKAKPKAKSRPDAKKRRRLTAEERLRYRLPDPDEEARIRAEDAAEMRRLYPPKIPAPAPQVSQPPVQDMSQPPGMDSIGEFIPDTIAAAPVAPPPMPRPPMGGDMEGEFEITDGVGLPPVTLAPPRPVAPVPARPAPVMTRDMSFEDEDEFDEFGDLGDMEEFVPNTVAAAPKPKATPAPAPEERTDEVDDIFARMNRPRTEEDPDAYVSSYRQPSVTGPPVPGSTEDPYDDEGNIKDWRFLGDEQFEDDVPDIIENRNAVPEERRDADYKPSSVVAPLPKDENKPSPSEAKAAAAARAKAAAAAKAAEKAAADKAAADKAAADKAAAAAAAAAKAAAAAPTPPPASPFAGGFNPNAMPTTAGQFAQAGNPGAAAMLNRMNQPTAIQSYLPTGRAEGGVIPEGGDDRGIPDEVMDAFASAVVAGDSETTMAFKDAFVPEVISPEEFDQLVEIIQSQESPEGSPQMPPQASPQMPPQMGPPMPPQMGPPQMQPPPMPPQMPPQMQGGGLVPGNGDGMADDIIVTADEGMPYEQDVAIGSGEFVIAADVVSGLGSGNTERGAGVLDQLQDDVRMQRTGMLDQPPPVDLSDVLPGTYGGQYA